MAGRVIRRALVLGRHADVWKEMEAVKKMATFHKIIAVKRAGRDYPGFVHEWVSFHLNMFPQFIADREKMGYPPAQRLWSGRHPKSGRKYDGHYKVHMLNCYGGSSGLLGIQVAREIGRPPFDDERPIDKIVLCGIPMEPTEKYDDGKLWKEALVYRESWHKVFAMYPELKDKVRSMSGWTKEQYGPVTEEWLHDDGHPEE